MKNDNDHSVLLLSHPSVRVYDIIQLGGLIFCYFNLGVCGTLLCANGRQIITTLQLYKKNFISNWKEVEVEGSFSILHAMFLTLILLENRNSFLGTREIWSWFCVLLSNCYTVLVEVYVL